MLQEKGLLCHDIIQIIIQQVSIAAGVRLALPSNSTHSQTLPKCGLRAALPEPELGARIADKNDWGMKCGLGNCEWFLALCFLNCFLLSG